MIIGSGGAGKSTLAKELGALLHIPVHHLDAYYWQPGWNPISREDNIRIQQTIFKSESWIIDGNYGSTMDDRMKACDTIIFLNYSTIRCLYGITRRRIQYRGKTRPDMGEGCPEKLDLQFIHWVANYKRKNTPAIKTKLGLLKDKNIIELKSPKQTRRFVKNIRLK